MLGALRLPASLELVHFATNGELLHIRIKYFAFIPLLHIMYRLAYVVLLGNKPLAQQKASDS